MLFTELLENYRTDYGKEIMFREYPDEKIEIVMDFGPRSYLNSHVIMFHDQNEKEIFDDTGGPFRRSGRVRVLQKPRQGACR